MGMIGYICKGQQENISQSKMPSMFSRYPGKEMSKVFFVAI